MILQTRTVPFEIKSFTDCEPGGDGIGQIEGIAAVYYNLDWKGDIIAPGAFDRDIAFTASQGKLRDEHGITTGRITHASGTATGLVIKAQILPTTNGNDQRILVKGGAVDKLSIGHQALERDYLYSEEEVKAWWATKGYKPTDDDLVMLGRTGGARILNRVKVYEVSTTWLPVNDQARITGIKSAAHVGITLENQLSEVLATIGDLIERAEKVKEIRHKSGKHLSTDTKARLKHLVGRIGTLTTALETKAATEQPSTIPTVQSEYARFLEISSGVTA